MIFANHEHYLAPVYSGVVTPGYVFVAINPAHQQFGLRIFVGHNCGNAQPQNNDSQSCGLVYESHCLTLFECDEFTGIVWALTDNMRSGGELTT